MKTSKFLMLFVVGLLALSPYASRAGTIDDGYRTAYGDVLGTVDFANVKVDSNILSGYAVTADDRIEFNSIDFKVNNDGRGNLTGYAQSKNHGIINFTGVTIDSDGYFHGMADGGFFSGKIYLNCSDGASCPAGANSRVRTTWRYGDPINNSPVVASPVIVTAVSAPALSGSGAATLGAYKSGAGSQAIAASTPTTTVAVAPVGGNSAVSYKDCDTINDYINYVKCIADVDAKRNSVAAPIVTNEILPGDAKDYSLKINAGAETTGKLSVALDIKYPAVAVTMAIASDNLFTSPIKEPVAKQKTFDLKDSDGAAQNVYVKFYDKADKPLYIASASITYFKPKADATQMKKAGTAFAKVFGRVAGESALDRTTLEIIAVGPANNSARDVAKEAEALKIYQKAYKSNSSGEQWNIVKAIAYYNAKKAETATETAGVTTADSAVTVCKPKKAIQSSLDVDMKGAEVAELQNTLLCLGYLSTGEFKAGDFGKSTEAAVQALQKDNDLKCKDGTYCGFVGPTTRKLINAGLKSAGPVTEVVPTKIETAKKPVAPFMRNLTIGDKGADVTKLQELLASDPEIYAGKATGQFDDATEKAVMKYQENNSLKCKDGTYCGYIGPATRAKLNSWYLEANK